ncbi:beta-galactosidase [Chitinibacter bivalviorum]|uniref:Beta-galactosidase n=1 Tax=Chitinibacter bivalviorum TaxID=2739434 RepID=A0A7H9BN78_9NEIS|nr:beta-galactosidase [Chitinibacter bivalviorum]QLG88844.1 beta-galactosidase [Chitinibacter bivalviorum]
MSVFILSSDPLLPAQAALQAQQAIPLDPASKTQPSPLAHAGAGDALILADCPRDFWPQVLAFLQRGGGLVSLGRFPLAGDDALFRDLNIHEALAVDCATAQVINTSHEYPNQYQYSKSFPANTPTCGLILMPTKHKDCANESGSSGPMDARIYPLLTANDAQDRAIAAPVVLIENHRGAFAGGRWVLANIDPTPAFWAQGGAAALLDWAQLSARGATEITIKPDFACYYPGEAASITLQMEALRASAISEWKAQLSVRLNDQLVHQAALTLHTGQHGPIFQRFTLPFAIAAGCYHIECQLTSAEGEVRQISQGFWGYDADLLNSGAPLECGRDYFSRAGKPVPIVGMTYMASDVHRKFLQLPNVAVWDADMAEFARMGINYVRTGIWTAWRQVMFADGHAQESAIRAITAFFLTAKRHELETCFTFFAFTPESWEGSNPYLDPRAIAAQKRFIAAIVSRHNAASHVHWDLINEPSMFDPQRVFLGPRTLRDPFEIAAFQNWLQAKEPDLNVWRARWHVSPADLPDWSAVRPPEPTDVGLNTTEISAKQHGIWLDYTLFTQDMHTQWAADLAETIRQIAPQRLVTVGQDEALGMQRPSPFFFAPAVDYTNVHSWWLNDDLAWDTIFSKTASKPSLVQETGIMHVEAPNGRSKRSEAELSRLLERKYAYGFINGGAGAVQWIWNINYHMDNINESHIGACRADGTRKPEAQISDDFGAFFKIIAPLMLERELEDIAVVYPFSNDYSNRRFAMEATQRLVRVLQYELKVPVRAISEYDLAALDAAPAKLVLVPSPHALCGAAREWLGKTAMPVLFTGPCDLDEHWNSTTPLFSETDTQNLQREASISIAGTRYRASFGGEKIARLYQGNRSGQIHRHEKKLWCPLPLEMNDRTEPLAALYREAMHLAEITPPIEWLSGEQAGVFIQKLSFNEASLWILVSESANDEVCEFIDNHNGQRYRLTLPSERAVLFACNAAGQLIASLRDHEVQAL